MAIEFHPYKQMVYHGFPALAIDIGNPCAGWLMIVAKKYDQDGFSRYSDWYLGKSSCLFITTAYL